MFSPTGKKHNFRKYNVSQVDSLGIPYDYLSVMHYSETAFGINGSTTIIAKNPSVIQMGQRIGLSPKDITQADLLYRCNGRSKSIYALYPQSNSRLLTLTVSFQRFLVCIWPTFFMLVSFRKLWRLF